MFRRSTSPPPSSTNQTVNDKLFNDWKRRFQQKAKLRFGLTSDIKDSVTGNLESRIERYRTISQKLLSMRTQCENFCYKFRSFLSLESSMSSFLPETFLSKFYDEIHQQHLSNVIEMMLVNEIELPNHFLSHKSEEIEQLLKHRTEGLNRSSLHHISHTLDDLSL
jgi:hypothetical protein